MTRYSILLALLCCSTLPMFAQSEVVPDAQPQILAKVIEREFLYSFGLSHSGTLGVDQVRYEMEIVDVWHSDAGLAKGSIVSVITQGGCKGLMNKDGRYLVSIHLATPEVTKSTSASTLVNRDANSQLVHTWQSSCAVASEATAQAVIAGLNKQRVANHSELHLSAN